MTRSVFALLVLASLLSACGAPVGIRTQPAPMDACEDALATGTLVSSAISGLAIRAGDGTVQEVLWPFGYTARREGTLTLLLDAAGRPVAREGELIQMGGGTDNAGVFNACTGSISVVAAPQ